MKTFPNNDSSRLMMYFILKKENLIFVSICFLYFWINLRVWLLWTTRKQKGLSKTEFKGTQNPLGIHVQEAYAMYCTRQSLQNHKEVVGQHFIKEKVEQKDQSHFFCPINHAYNIEKYFTTQLNKLVNIYIYTMDHIEGKIWAWAVSRSLLKFGI